MSTRTRASINRSRNAVKIAVAKLHRQRAFAAGDGSKSPRQFQPITGDYRAFRALRHQLGDRLVGPDHEEERALLVGFGGIVSEVFGKTTPMSDGGQRSGTPISRRLLDGNLASAQARPLLPDMVNGGVAVARARVAPKGQGQVLTTIQVTTMNSLGRIAPSLGEAVS